MRGRRTLRCAVARCAVAVTALVASIFAFSALTMASTALGDGDPASDVLANYNAFIPPDANATPAAVQRLDALLAVSAHAGFPIRVALIGSAADLGSVTQLWGRPPGTYAVYLQRELSDLYDGQVLVVMPRGFGLSGPSQGSHAVSAAELAVRAPAPSAGAHLIASAVTAVPLLAAAAGHPIPVGQIHLTAATARPKSAAIPAGSLLALLLGAIAIMACWRASLRARPWNVRASNARCPSDARPTNR